VADVVSRDDGPRAEAGRRRGHDFALDGRDACALAYGDDFEGYVIPPGRNPIYFNPFVTKEESVLGNRATMGYGKAGGLADPAHAWPAGLHCGSG